MGPSPQGEGLPRRPISSVPSPLTPCPPFTLPSVPHSGAPSTQALQAPTPAGTRSPPASRPLTQDPPSPRSPSRRRHGRSEHQAQWPLPHGHRKTPRPFPGSQDCPASPWPRLPCTMGSCAGFCPPPHPWGRPWDCASPRQRCLRRQQPHSAREDAEAGSPRG